jgi:anaerobic dimethyl sulfoxide reductase subunit B (iron-sulfur subunit)
MKQRVFVFATDRCFGCAGCVAACAAANRTPAGGAWREVLKLPPQDGDHRTIYLSLACNHCETAPCVEACPSGALYKRAEDGVVVLRTELCIGCRYCQMACPYDAIRWDERQRVVAKCDFCARRLDRGRAPACVEVCFAGALTQRVIDAEPDGCEREAPGFHHLEEARPAIRFLHATTAQRLGRTEPFPPAAPADASQDGRER